MGIGSSGVANYANTRLALAIRTIALGDMGDFEVVSDDGVGLGLNFQTMTALDPRITFSRASNATLVGSDGLIQYAPHNLLTYSENFDDAVWIKTTSTVTANTVIAPDGTITADTLTANGVDSALGEQNISTTAGQSYVFSVYLKADAPTILSIFIVDGGGGSGNTQQVVSVTTSWQRFTVTRTLSAGTTVVSCQIGGANSFSTGESVYLWGAQLNEGSLQPYYTTSVKNLLNYSQNFDNATGWVSAAPYSVTPNTITGPDGVTNADAIILASGSTSFNTNVTRQIVTKAASAIRYTHSCYIKAKGATTSVRIVDFGSTTANSALVIVSLIDGSIISAPSVTGTFTGASVIVESLQNGWFRVALTYTSDTATTLTIRHFPYNGSTQLVGDGVSGLYLWGAQLSDSASLDPYSYNFGAAPTSTAYYGPRFDYDPVTLAPKGLLIEEQQTNLLTYSSEFDNAAWFKGAGVTVTINQVAAPDGTVTADLITSPEDQGCYENLLSVGTGVTVTNSIYIKAGTATQLLFRDDLGTGRHIVINPETGQITGSSGTILSSGSSSMGNGWYRYYMTYVTDSVNARNWVRNNTAGTLTYYTWGAQVEVGAFPTSYIPTTSAAVTRAADNASMVGTNFSSWYNQSEGTVSSGYDVILNTGSRIIFDIGANGAFGTTVYSVQTSSYVGLLPGTAPVTMTSTVNTTSLVNKIATGLQNNNSIISVNGALGGLDSICTMPSNATTLTIGCSQFGGVLNNYLNGHIQSIKYYPRRLANGDLQAITS